MKPRVKTAAQLPIHCTGCGKLVTASLAAAYAGGSGELRHHIAMQL